MEFEVEGGTLTVEVQPASEQDGLREGGRREYWAEAEVRVTGEVKVRGIAYTVRVQYRWLRTPTPVYEPRGVDSGRVTNWRWDWRTSDGYRRVSSGKKADSSSAADKAIDAMVLDALEQFNKAQPNWQKESFRLLTQQKIDHETSEAARLRAKAAEHEAAAKELHAELGRSTQS